ncbi:hypothetical protein BJY00DRAFT_313224 [Aspergillus carlsbadensis]|nr:hypothetical protein BJY00DRAFT_313224 [Aspergillus carlsbadensis]
MHTLLAALVYILAPVQAAFADDFEILAPTSGQGYSRDERITVAWDYSIDYDGPISIQFAVTNPASVSKTMTIQMPATYSGFEIAPSVLPYVGPSETVLMHIWVYTTYVVSSQTISDYSGVRDLSITGPTSTPPTTVQQTVTVAPMPSSPTTSSDDSEPTETDLYYPPMIDGIIGEDDEEFMEDGGGLSTGAKAGIGAGVAVGAILLVVGAILFHRRRKLRTPPKTIREITRQASQDTL